MLFPEKSEWANFRTVSTLFQWYFYSRIMNMLHLLCAAYFEKWTQSSQLPYDMSYNYYFLFTNGEIGA